MRFAYFVTYFARIALSWLALYVVFALFGAFVYWDVSCFYPSEWDASARAVFGVFAFAAMVIVLPDV